MASRGERKTQKSISAPKVRGFARKEETFTPRNPKEERLVQALKTLETEQDFANFMRDLLTPAELEEFANRFEIAKKLLEGDPYLKIANDVGTSTTTVTRVAHWLFRGCGGYWKALEKLKNK